MEQKEVSGNGFSLSLKGVMVVPQSDGAIVALKGKESEPERSITDNDDDGINT